MERKWERETSETEINNKMIEHSVTLQGLVNWIQIIWDECYDIGLTDNKKEFGCIINGYQLQLKRVENDKRYEVFNMGNPK